MQKLILAVFALTLIAPVVRVRSQNGDPIVGTWELNIAKSTYRTGAAPKQETRTFEAVGDSLKYTAKGIDAQGKPTLRQFVAKYDGKDYPATGHATADTIAYTRIDDHTSQAVLKKAGTVVITNTRVVTRDGKMFTLTDNGTDGAGKPISNVLVFERR
jgi:hypothetical protein